MKEATDEEKAELKEKYPRVYPVRLELQQLEEEVEFLVRAPTSSEYKLFVKTAADQDTRHNATRNIALDCTLWPPRKELDAMVAKAPGLLDSLSNPITTLGGLVKAEAGKAI